jgi:nucleoid DNA-binding protein
MSKNHLSPLQARIKQFLGCTNAHARDVQRAFVEALKEEVESRWKVGYVPGSGIALDPNAGTPLVISGLGSFKMRTRPAKTFRIRKRQGVDLVHIDKGPCRRLVFTSKWEPLP